MGTPSAMPSGPGSWVRGPKNPQRTPPPAGPAAGPDDTGGPTAPTDAYAPAPGGATAAPAAPGTGGPTAPGAGPAHAPAGHTVPGAASPARPAPDRTPPAHTTPGATPGGRPAPAQVPAEQVALHAHPGGRGAGAGEIRDRGVPARAAGRGRTAPGSATEPSWGRPKRPGTARAASRDTVGWVKAHGGSGATSLAELFGGVEVGTRWPDPARGEPRRVVLVGRTGARGLRSVSQALGALQDGDAPQGLELLAVVLVADAPGRLPLALLRRIRVLRSVARVHRVPWIPAWRTGGRPASVPRQLAALARLVGAEAHTEGAAS
ncbi:hypothetical protein [Streptomyces aureus]